MRRILIASLLLPAAALAADEFYGDSLYKCVKNGKTTYQEMPCGWSALGNDRHKNAEQHAVPLAVICEDRTLEDKRTLKNGCPNVTLPKSPK